MKKVWLIIGLCSALCAGICFYLSMHYTIIIFPKMALPLHTGTQKKITTYVWLQDNYAQHTVQIPITDDKSRMVEAVLEAWLKNVELCTGMVAHVQAASYTPQQEIIVSFDMLFLTPSAATITHYKELQGLCRTIKEAIPEAQRLYVQEQYTIPQQTYLDLSVPIEL